MSRRFGILIIVVAIVAGWKVARPHLQQIVDDFYNVELTDSPQQQPVEETRATLPRQPQAPSSAPPSQSPTATNAEPLDDLIERLVQERYPDPKIRPFDAVVGDWSALPKGAYPQRVSLNETLKLRYQEEGKLLATSVIFSGGHAKPVLLTGQQLLVASLGDERMRSDVPVMQTDFKSRVERHYHSFVEEVNRRVELMRQSDTALLKARGDLSDRIRRFENWDQPSSSTIEVIKAGIARGDAGKVDVAAAKRFIANGDEEFEIGDLRGAYTTVTVYFETETAFGVEPTGVKCVMRPGKVARWIKFLE